MITTEMIKALRERSGAGMMDCKRALEACDGDLDKASDWLREKGIAKAAKKADRIAAEGLCAIAVKGNRALICEVNSETDFVAKNEKFITLVNQIAQSALDGNAHNTQEALEAKVGEININQLIVNSITVIGEKISLRRVTLLEKSDLDVFGTYLHMGGKIGVITVLKNSNDQALAKDIAMHIAASNPIYVNESQIGVEEYEREKHIQLEASKNDEKLKDKPEAALLKIIEGKMGKWKQEVCLVGQAFLKDPSINVGKHLENHKTHVENFVRYLVGEGLEKRNENFANEVYNQVGK